MCRRMRGKHKIKNKSQDMKVAGYIIAVMVKDSLATSILPSREPLSRL